MIPSGPKLKREMVDYKDFMEKEFCEKELCDGLIDLHQKRKHIISTLHCTKEQPYLC